MDIKELAAGKVTSETYIKSKKPTYHRKIAHNVALTLEK